MAPMGTFSFVMLFLKDPQTEMVEIIGMYVCLPTHTLILGDPPRFLQGKWQFWLQNS